VLAAAFSESAWPCLIFFSMHDAPPFNCTTYTQRWCNAPPHTCTFLSVLSSPLCRDGPQVIVTLAPNSTSAVKPGNPVTFTYFTAPYPVVAIPALLRATAGIGCALDSAVVLPANFAAGDSFTVSFTPDPAYVVDPNDPCTAEILVFDAADTSTSARTWGYVSTVVTYEGGGGGGGSSGDVSVTASFSSPPFGSTVSVGMLVTQKPAGRRHLLAGGALVTDGAAGAALAPVLHSRALLAGTTLAIVIDWGDGSPRWRSPLDGVTLPASLAAQHTYAGQSASGTWTVAFFIEKVGGAGGLAVLHDRLHAKALSRPRARSSDACDTSATVRGRLSNKMMGGASKQPPALHSP
jgi:hypothetical protein